MLRNSKCNLAFAYGQVGEQLPWCHNDEKRRPASRGMSRKPPTVLETSQLFI